MFSEELPIFTAPQFGGFSVMVSGCAGVLLVTVITRWSPGFTCSVGSSAPSVVMKHNNSVPSVSNRCWYEKRTLSTPFALKSAGGLWTTPPAAKRGQGLATGGTDAAELLVVTVDWPNALTCKSMSTIRLHNMPSITRGVLLLFMILLQRWLGGLDLGKGNASQ